MSTTAIRQFVPSHVCLKCDGCCRYKEEASAWRPKLGAEDRQQLASLINAGDVLDSQSYIKTIQTCGEHFCQFLNRGNNTCGVYNNRPFECALYPFILSQTPDALKVYAHLSCPYVQDQLPAGDFESYVAYLKEFFHRPDIREFLIRQRDMFHDYSPYAPELLHLFDLTYL